MFTMFCQAFSGKLVPGKNKNFGTEPLSDSNEAYHDIKAKKSDLRMYHGIF